MKKQVKGHLVQKLLSSHTDRHTRMTSLTGPLKW